MKSVINDIAERSTNTTYDKKASFTGFARNQFNYGEGQENVGNNVTLVSDTRSYLCDMHKDGTHEKQITCYTR